MEMAGVEGITSETTSEIPEAENKPNVDLEEATEQIISGDEKNENPLRGKIETENQICQQENSKIEKSATEDQGVANVDISDIGENCFVETPIEDTSNEFQTDSTEKSLKKMPSKDNPNSDSFEKIEEEIQRLSLNNKEQILTTKDKIRLGEIRSDSLAIYAGEDEDDKPFEEDYGILEGTELILGQQSEMGSVDLLRDLTRLARLRELEFENEKALELLEVETEIRLAEEKSIADAAEYEPCKFFDNTQSEAEKIDGTLEVAPVLTKVENIKLPPDLLRMESSDLSEEESYRQRLSCIFEESESDASGSGAVIRNSKRMEPIQKAEIKAEETKDISNSEVVDVNDPTQNDENNGISENVAVEATANNEPSVIIESQTPEETTDVVEEEQQRPKRLEKMESVETNESTSPEPRQEPGFGIQRLKSGSHVEKLLTRPVVIKRRDSSSDSSLDLSVTASTAGGDAEICITEVEQGIEVLGQDADNVQVELPKNEESDMREKQNACDITELTEDDLRTLFPKVRFGRRGKSLDTGHAEKIKEEKKIQKKTSKSETSSQKGEEDRPPIPPETYLWEELRRWRLKGGYPWTHLDKPPFDEKTWKKMTDHEYEPINPPPFEINIDKPIRDEDRTREERHFLRIPRDEELVVSPEDMEVEAIAIAQDLQDGVDGRYSAITPMTTATSRTDCDVNTSMLDSSGLEDLPLKRDSRSKKAIQSKTEQMRAQAQGIQQRLRSQAGKLRNKLRSIPRPSFQRKQERPKEENAERSRFKLPERPKFNLPERPKFKMPQKPKIALPNFAKPLRERPNQSQAGPKKNIFDIDFKTYPRMFSKKSKDRGDYATSSPKLPRSATPPPPPIQPARKKGPVGQRWVNRFDDIKYADDKTSEISRRSDRSESLSGFHEKDFAITDDMDNVELPPPRALSTKSSLSHLSDREIQSSRSSEDRHRKGVIEEIDSDQFFLRQKGISEEDIDMGKYLSNEIREAFRSPVVNALRQMDYDYDQEAEKENLQQMGDLDGEPLPPTRTRSLKKTPKREDSDSSNVKPSQSVGTTVNESISKTRYENVAEDYNSEHYKTPPPPIEYQHYKVPKAVRPTPMKRKSSSTEQTSNKKRPNGWVEVEIETSFEEVQKQQTPQPLKRKRSKKGLGGAQISLDAGEDETGQEEPDYIIPVESPPEPPVRTRSLSRGARSTHSLAQDEEKPVPPKRTSSKSLHSLGISSNVKTGKNDMDSKSLHSWGTEESKNPVLAPVRYYSKSLPRGAKSFHSLASCNPSGQPKPPERTRSLSRASQSYHSIIQNESGQLPQAPERMRSLSRSSKLKPGSTNQIETVAVIERNPHYEAPTVDDGYAVVDKSGNKPKPPRPPPPRKKKGSSPTFNTFPRRSPIRPVRNYATLGPSRPPRRSRVKPTSSVEHIYTADAISESYAELDANKLQPIQVEDLHGSNKDLQADDVVEKMKGRPLPAPPRPPRLRSKEEQNQSLEEVEEVCVATQTDPLPDDLCLEDDMIQEFSHEQLKVQEEFLDEMRAEEERIRREIEEKRAKKIDVTAEKAENDAKLEIIKQMDSIIQEERRLMFDPRPQEESHDEEDIKKSQLQVLEDDMGYASLDRRQVRQEEEPQPSTSFQPPPQTQPQAHIAQPSTSREPVYIPLIPEVVSTERLRVGSLEVERLNVNELQANSILAQNIRSQTYETQDMRGTILQIQDITSRSGNISLGNIEIPPDLVQQILLRIPWEDFRPPAPVTDVEQAQQTTKQKKQLTEEEEATVSSPTQPTTRRRHRQIKQQSRTRYSSDDEAEVRQVSRRHARAVINEPTISDLSRQLAKACTSVSMRAMRQFVEHIRPPSDSESSTQYRMQAALCVILVVIAGCILLGISGSDVHHHHWDFQFPPQPREQ